jgi:sulfatase modifying factor 1
MLLFLLGCIGTDSNQDFVVIAEDTEIQSKTPTDEPLILSKKTTSTSKDITSADGMVQIPEDLVALGPRNVEAVEGYALPQTSGITPNNGAGNNQRDAGGPPLPPNSPNKKGGPNPKNPSQNGAPNHPNQMNGNGNGGDFPQHKPQFSLENKGVGHMRPGSGTPSAPPNMPGSEAKMIGEEKPWTANPSNQMKPKKVRVSSFLIDRTEVTRNAYKEFLDATGYRPPFVSEEWAKDGWNWSGTDYPEGTGDHPVVLVSWYDAQEYCAWREKRLPTEAEWQLAALGSLENKYAFPWGKKYLHDVHNHGQIESPNFDDSDGYLTTSPVGAFPKGNTPLGVQDIFGNAWEFTADARRATWKFYENVTGDDLRDSYAPTPTLYVAVRGGSYFFDLRPFPGGERNEFLTEVRRKTAGFRCAK